MNIKSMQIVIKLHVFYTFVNVLHVKKGFQQGLIQDRNAYEAFIDPDCIENTVEMSYVPY
jgi:hypothetical protein